MTPTPVIEKVSPRHADDLFEVFQSSAAHSRFPIGPNWSREQWLSECRNSGWVSRSSQGQVLAFLLFRELVDAWEISLLATAPDARGQGLMKQLFARLFAEKPLDKAVWLEVHEGNQAARNLYESLGFKQTGLRPRYYADGGSAVLYNYG